ncbi:MAG: hypothetical protein CVV06_00570 [Gammaproteobacteria bacterium HGW-Gammaproteobacteria-10]|nr:MAG: hypothetical protein CVV06_00570 [Gammaproteobacteria bacterium HGW-Gammaproteobacteria-10]HBA66443.1 hypothetical protein [Methylococcaceae bacterium]
MYIDESWSLGKSVMRYKTHNSRKVIFHEILNKFDRYSKFFYSESILFLEVLYKLLPITVV